MGRYKLALILLIGALRVHAVDTTIVRTNAKIRAHCAFNGNLWLAIGDKVKLVDTSDAAMVDMSVGLEEGGFTSDLHSIGGNVFALNNRRLMKFNSRTERWENISPITSTDNPAFWIIGGNENMLFTGEYGGDFYISQNRGDTWKVHPISDSLTTYDCILPINGGWLVGGENSDLFFLKDDLTFSRVQGFVPKRKTRSGVGFLRRFDKMYYLFNLSDGIYCSEHGLDWKIYFEGKREMRVNAVSWKDGIILMYGDSKPGLVAGSGEYTNFVVKDLQSPILRQTEHLNYHCTYGPIEIMAGQTSMLILK